MGGEVIIAFFILLTIIGIGVCFQGFAIVDMEYEMNRRRVERADRAIEEYLGRKLTEEERSRR